MANPQTDEALMVAYAAGDRAAFESLFARLAPRIYRFFRRAFRNESLADDLFQSTFMKVHQSRAAYDPGRPLGPWLFSIAARVRFDELRRQYRLPAEATEDSLDLVETQQGLASAVEDDLDRADSSRAVRAAIARLPATQRAVVSLHHDEGMTFAEIASVLGTTEGAARVRAFRAYAKIREDMRCFVEGETT